MCRCSSLGWFRKPGIVPFIQRILLVSFHNFFVLVATLSTNDRELEESEEKVDTLPGGSVCTSESDVSDVGEGEGECQSQEDSDSEYNSATEVDTTETETDGESCVPSKYNQYVLIVQFQKISILPPTQGIGISLGGGGFCKAKKLTKMYEAYLEFPEG